MLKLAASIFAASLAWAAAGSAAAPPPPAMNSETFQQQFSLKPGESAPTQFDPAWRVGFEGVLVDSRCPKGAQCVWAGDATVRVWLQRGAEARLSFELSTPPAPRQAISTLGYQLRLLQLDPYPVAGKAVVLQDYVATLALELSSTKE